VGGAERLLVDLVPRLRVKGIDASVVALQDVPAEPFLAERLRNGAGNLPGSPLHVPSKAMHLHSPMQVLHLRRALRGADLIHTHLFQAQLWTAVAVRSLPRQERPILITTEHNTNNRRRGRAMLRAVDAAMYSLYACIIAVSEGTAQSIKKWLPATGNRLLTIPNGVDVSAITGQAAADRQKLFGVGPEVTLIACTGRFEPQKDQATLIRALHLVPHVHAVFLGDGPMRPEAERLAASLGVADRAHFLGIRADVAAVLKACDLYCQPSRWEGFGIAVVEALAAGLPTLVSDVPGVTEIVGDVGSSFKPQDPAALAAALTALLDDRTELAALARRAPQRAQQYDTERCVEAHVALYEQLWGESGIAGVSGRRWGPTLE
jgi:glycosyltransferase involved in cell wall biosynthesis